MLHYLLLQMLNHLHLKKHLFLMYHNLEYQHLHHLLLRDYLLYYFHHYYLFRKLNYHLIQ